MDKVIRIKYDLLVSGKFDELLRLENEIIQRIVNRPISPVVDVELKELYIDLSNQLIDIRTLPLYKDVIELKISAGYLTELPKLLYPPNLRKLTINGMFLQKLNQLFVSISVESLYIISTKNGFHTFPIDVTSIKTLENLTFDGSGFKSIPSEISNLSNLKTFTSTNGELLDSRTLTKLINLISLNLSHNQIREFPSSQDLYNLTAIESIDLSDNQITKLGPKLPSGETDVYIPFYTEQLSYLNLQNNKVDEWPPEFGLIDEKTRGTI